MAYNKSERPDSPMKRRGGRRRKKNEIPPEGRVIRGKGNGSHFDCSI